MKRLLLTLLLLPVFAHAQIITTIAGGGTILGDGGPATAASFTNPHFLAFDKFGSLFISDFMGCRVRKIDVAGIITTVVGTGIAGVIGDGGPATAAYVKFPEGIACDTFGNLYIADHQNYRIRKVDVSTGIISTFAGTGTVTFTGTGDGGPATAATFYTPADVKFDRKGNLYVSDNSACTIRKINTSGIITNFAGIGHLPGFSGDGGPATAALLNDPGSLAIDDIGNVYIADGQNKRVRKIDTFGIITTVAGTGIALYSGDGIPATSSNVGPLGIAVFNNNVYITDSNLRMRSIDPSGIIHTIVGTGIAGFSGDGGPATNARINESGGIAVDTCGNIYFSDALNVRIRKVTFDTSCGRGDGSLNVRSISPSSFNLYPNPASTSVTISSSDNITSISITNLIGQVLYNQQYNAPQVQIDVADLPKGMYLIRINGSEVRKFVKQ
jgi:trimeric autotransporter adhesin